MQSDRFRKVVHEAAPGVLLFLFEGDVPFETFAPCAEVMDECLRRRGKFSTVGNGDRWDNYGSGYREAWTTWFLANRASVTRVDLLIRSAILRMAVQIVNMATRGVITTYSNLPALEAGARRLYPTLDLSPIMPRVPREMTAR